MEELNHLLEIPGDDLRSYAVGMRRKWDQCLWSLGLVLLVVEQRALHALWGFSGVVQFAVRVLGMDRHKASELLRVMKALLELPLLADDFRTGELGWGKIRELTRVATPETELQLRDFSRAHDADEVQRHVTVSPRALKSAGSKPERAMPLLLETQARHEDSASGQVPSRESCHCGTPGDAATPGVSQVSAAPAPTTSVEVQPAGKLVKLTFYLTPEEYASYERGEDYVRAQSRKRLRRNDVLMDLVKTRLASASPRSLARLPVVVRVEPQSGAGWYDTRNGLQPATPDEVERALNEAKEILVVGASPVEPGLFEPEQPPRRTGRRKISPKVLRALIARSGGRCEVPGCGTGGLLHVHHKRPVSRKGRDRLEDLELRCPACHGLGHKDDFEFDPIWSNARRRRQEEAARKVGRKKKRQLRSRESLKEGSSC